MKFAVVMGSEPKTQMEKSQVDQSGVSSISVRDCLNLKRGSVVRLRQPSGSELAVTVRGVQVALGEVVVMDERTTVRITHITRPPDNEADN